jgi:hypothetical protein
VADVLAADFVRDRPYAGDARHGVPSEKQVITGADQAGVKQHRIHLAELTGFDAFGEQASMKVQQRRDKELGDFVGGLGAAFMQQIMDQAIHVRELMVRADDARDVQPQFR